MYLFIYLLIYLFIYLFFNLFVYLFRNLPNRTTIFFIELILVCTWLVKTWVTEQAFSELLRQFKFDNDVKGDLLGRI